MVSNVLQWCYLSLVALACHEACRAKKCFKNAVSKSQMCMMALQCWLTLILLIRMVYLSYELLYFLDCRLYVTYRIVSLRTT